MSKFNPTLPLVLIYKSRRSRLAQTQDTPLTVRNTLKITGAFVRNHSLLLMLERNHNTFFTKDVYDTEIALDVNADVLERIYRSNVTPDTSLPIEFFYVSDKEDKLKLLGLHLLTNFPRYTDLKIQPYNDNFELSGNTHPIKMDLSAINEWNQQMWDIGYEFDCKLDGWQVGH